MNNEASSVGCSHPQKDKKDFRLPQNFGLRALLSQIQTNKEDKKIIVDLKKQLDSERMASKILKARSKLFANSAIPSMESLNIFTNILGITKEELVGEHASSIRAHYEGGVKFRNNNLLGETMLYLYARLESHKGQILSATLQQVIEKIYLHCQKYHDGLFNVEFANRVISEITAETGRKPSIQQLVAAAFHYRCSLQELTQDANRKRDPDIADKEGFVDHSLLSSILIFFASVLEKGELIFYPEEFMNYVRELYVYSLENHNGKLHEGFAVWLLDRKR